MKAGTRVRIAGTTLEGVVVKRRVEEATDEDQYLVSWTNAQGEQHERWFVASQLEAAEVQP